MPQTILAFDFGTLKMGVAIGQTITGTANPLPILKARDGIPNWDEIEKIIREWKPDKILVGLPLNMDGSYSELANLSEKFSRRLHGRFNIEVELVDERLSSFAAQEDQKEQTGKSHSPVDSVAACYIFESWMNAQGTR